MAENGSARHICGIRILETPCDMTALLEMTYSTDLTGLRRYISKTSHGPRIAVGHAR